MKTSKNHLFTFALIPVTALLFSTSAVMADDVAPPQLINVPAKDEAIAGTYDFGKANVLDSTQKDLDLQDMLELKMVNPGIKHIFTLQNAGETPVTN